MMDETGDDSSALSRACEESLSVGGDAYRGAGSELRKHVLRRLIAKKAEEQLHSFAYRK